MNVLSRSIVRFVFLWAVCALSVRTHANRFDEYTNRYADPEHGATPVSASYLGGRGDEYLIAGDFRSDGMLYLAGNAFGPSFDLGGVNPQVLGTDRAAPDFTMPKDKKDAPNPPASWKHRDGAGFVVVLSPDYRQILRAVRFPWGSGVLTDLVTDEQGRIFITGTVGENFASLGPSKKIEVDNAEGGGELFVARLTPDLSGFEWLIRLQDETDNTPQLRAISHDILSVVGANGFHLTPEGEVIKSLHVGITGGWQRGVCFKTFAQVKGDFHRSNTGWEPWHQPFVYFFNPDQSVRFRFYQWDSRTVGTNWSRLVSDSKLRMAAFDRNGQPVLAGWSDGGNSVWAHVPYDITRQAGQAIEESTGRKSGLPFSTWGANVGSFLHFNRLDFETGNPLSYTLYISYLQDKNKPNSIAGNNLDFTVDNDMMMSGGSAWGLIQTKSTVVNTLSIEEGDYIGGDFFAILTENWDDIRYSSAVPGGGMIDLVRHSASVAGTFRFGSSHVNGKTRVVAVSGARTSDKFKQISPVQSGFGGGDLDGLFVVLEMDTLPPLPEPVFSHPSSARRENSVPESDDSLEGLFVVSPGMRNSDSILFLRDTAGKKWPAYYRGNPEGEGVVNAAGSGSFTLKATAERVQLGGEAGEEGVARRLGGTVSSEDVYPELELNIRLISRTEAAAEIRYNGRRLELRGPMSMRKSRPSGKGAALSGEFRTTKRELGLSESEADASDEIIIGWWAPGRPAPADVKEKQGASAPTSGSPAVSSSELRSWTNTEGQKVEAAMEAVRDSGVLLKLANGRMVTVPLETLSEQDRAHIHDGTQFRLWTNLEGKSIIARKLRATDALVEVETPGRQTYSLPLDQLSKQDRDYATK